MTNIHYLTIRVAAIFAAALIVFSAIAPPANAAQGLANFTGREIQSSDLKPFPKWTGVIDRYFDQKQLASTPCGSTRFNPCTLRQWKAKIDSLQGQSLMTKINEVNTFLNKVRYVVDPVNWGVEDYWSTPNEFFDIDGDCEDYAIAKFISLRALGIPNDQMRIMIVQDMNLGGIMHGILAVRVNGKTLILDNQIPRVTDASSIYHYRSIYSINETAWWRH